MSLTLATLLLLSSMPSQGGETAKPPARPRKDRFLPEERAIDTKLFAALRKGDVARVRDLLAKGADPNANEANGWRPLLRIDGTPAQRLAITKLLIAKGANVNHRQPDQGWTALTHLLNGQADLPIVRYLILKGVPVNLGMRDGTTALHFAARGRDVAIVRESIRAGADVKARTHEEPLPDGWNEPMTGSPLEARSRERSRQKTDEENAAMSARYFEPGYRGTGQTPIFNVVGAWNEGVLDELLKAGASLTESDDGGWTVLHWAISRGDLEAAKSLLKRGLDPNAATKGGFRPLHTAMRVGFGFPYEDAVTVLLAAGADPKATNAAGQTPLEMLRADADRNLGEWQRDHSDDPQSREMVPRYLEVANKIARRLDPGAAAILLPTPAPPAEKPFETIEFYALEAERKFVVEGGRTFLELAIGAPGEEAMLVLKAITLDDYEPMTPLPLRVEVAAKATKTVRIEFPSGARRDGAFSLEWEEGDAGGSLGNGNPFEPKFALGTGAKGRSVLVKNEHADRTLEVTLDVVKINGKAVPSLAGRLVRVPPKGGVPIEGLVVPKGKVGLRFRQRLLPNSRWIEGSTTLSSKGAVSPAPALPHGS